jgi:signal transduction histidine kinase
VLKSPRPLLGVLLTTTVVVTIVLCALGWVLLHQQREIDRQTVRTALEDSADALAAAIRGRLADAGDRLGAWLSDRSAPPPVLDNAVVLGIDGDRVSMSPARGLPFVPVVPPDESAGAFEELERLEFRDRRLVEAAARYRALERDVDPRVRAGALFRLGRVLRAAGDRAGALAAYDRLGALHGVRVAALPADLAALLGRRAVLSTSGDRARTAVLNQTLQTGLDEGRWAVLRGEADLYRDDAASAIPRPPTWDLAAAVADVWRDGAGRAARGQRTIVAGDRGVVVLWRASTPRAAIAVAFAEDFFGAVAPHGTRWRLAAGGQLLADRAGGLSSGAVTRVVDAEQPWRLDVWPMPSRSARLEVNRAVAIMLAVTLLFVWGTAHLMARAIRREAEVARLQSDFVAAVSHEFRSPLTTVRQLAELLDTDRLPTEERRHTYYRLISSEAGRLQRLVETLLNFGRIEAGGARYRFAYVETAALVRDVVLDVDRDLPEAAARLEVAGPEEGALVHADAAALGVALRTLIDNAIKYSPGEPVVRVEWAAEAGRVAIRVIDRGLGIPENEQAAIFRKFVRGQSSVRANVKGTGVGLAMVRQIVLAHQGHVRLESEVDRGSTFSILLPLRHPSADRQRLTA